MPNAQNESERGLVIFDVDGTLCDTTAVDEECYLKACREALVFDPNAIDWLDAPQITDTAILQWLWTEHLGRLPSPKEVSTVQNRFVELLSQASVESPNRFRAISGAPEMLADLPSYGWKFTAATGSWRTSAVLKLRAAGISPDILGASSTDSPVRSEVFRLAASRASLPNGEAQSIVLVGDGLWDVQVAAELGFRFVGINSGPQADQLRQAGAQTVVADFADVGRFLQALEDCRATFPT